MAGMPRDGGPGSLVAPRFGWGRCVLADRPCNESGTCALHVPWLRARAQLLGELAATSVAEASMVTEGAR